MTGLTRYPLVTQAGVNITTQAGNPIVIRRPLIADLDTVGVSYSVDLCADYVKVGELAAGTFDAVIRLLAAGEWHLTARREGLDVSDTDLATVNSVIVRDDTSGAIVLAGIVRTVPSVNGSINQQITDHETIYTLRGVDEFGVLGTRLCWPDPTTAPPWAAAHDERTGTGSTVAAAFIAANIGATAIAARQIANLTSVDPAVGTSSTWKGRLQPLDELIGRICRESGIRCIASMPTPGELEYRFGTVRDRSSSLMFTDQGDLEELSQLVTPSAGTHVLAAGQGNLADRQFATADSGATGLSRVETLHENTNISLDASLQLAADTELAQHGASVAVDGVVAENASQRIQWRTDYDLGDLIGVEINGTRYSTPVEAVSMSLSANRQLVTPVLGRATASDLVNLLRQVDGIRQIQASQIA